MKNLLFTTALALVLFSCNSTSNKKSATDSQADKSEQVTTAVEVDSILANPAKYLEKNISIKGLVIHTCRHTGKKMFLAGSDKNTFVKVIVGNNISTFGQELEGETVIATGKLAMIGTEDEQKHKEKEHDNSVESKDSSSAGCVTETKIKNYEMTCSAFSVVK